MKTSTKRLYPERYFTCSLLSVLQLLGSENFKWLKTACNTKDRKTLELLEGKDLRNCMLKGYTNNPKGWSFVVSPSPTSGFFDATVSGPDATWILKIDSMFRPCPIVIGSQAEAGPLRPESPFSYGYRKLPPNLVLQLLGDEDGASRDKRGWLASCLCSGRNHGCRRRGKATLRVPSC